MGYITHYAILVTSPIPEMLAVAHARASDLFDRVSPLSPRRWNGVASFWIPPSGRKVGTAGTTEEEAHRDQFVAWLETQCYEDGSSSLVWVEVQYGETADENDASPQILRYSGMHGLRKEA